MTKKSPQPEQPDMRPRHGADRPASTGGRPVSKPPSDEPDGTGGAEGGSTYGGSAGTTQTGPAAKK